MKFFEMPEIEVTAFAVEDIITTSTPPCDSDFGDEEFGE